MEELQTDIKEQKTVEVKHRSKYHELMSNPTARTILSVIGFAVILCLFTALTGGKIIEPSNIKLLLSETYVLLIASTGVFLLMTMGCIDFSQGSILGVSSIVICYLSNYNIFLAILGGMAIGAAIGAINGFFNVKRKIPSFIVTICTMFLFRGVCAFLTTNSPVYAGENIFNYNTVSIKLIITIIIVLVVFLIFHFTKLGYNLKAIGSGETASRFAGIKVDQTKWIIFMVAGMITGLAAFLNVIKVGSVTSTGGNMLETEIMIALVLGGMPISGGALVRFSNIILGVFTYRVLSTGLNMIGLTTEMQQLIEGVVFIIVVAIFSDRNSTQVVK